MAALSAWIERAQPTLMVVDVSVEVAALCRLHGVPVVVVAMPGERRDRAHHLGYDLAEALLACWPSTAADPDWPPSWTDKTWFVGGFSRYDRHIGETTPEVMSPDSRRRQVTFLLGGGGTDLPDGYLSAAMRATPNWDWDIIGGPSSPWRADPWPSLQTASVIISHAGQNAVAEVAAARTPAIIIAQSRPHAEQHARVIGMQPPGAVRKLIEESLASPGCATSRRGGSTARGTEAVPNAVEHAYAACRPRRGGDGGADTAARPGSGASPSEESCLARNHPGESWARGYRGVVRGGRMRRVDRPSHRGVTARPVHQRGRHVAEAATSPG